MYTVEIQAGIDRTDELLKEIEQEKQVQAQLDADLRRGDKRRRFLERVQTYVQNLIP